ncbi:HAMP domain-containing sensor histidine kinase [Pediococcus argentinicus]|uniref:HAMP domain-containing sensor histidine kinase n=1 Tax=Pediococcus argentinicus TaxID=480391 RepID=UPI00338DDA60
MKLVYQQMIAFLIVTLSTLLVLGLIFIRFSTNMVYRNKWSSLEGYADSLYQQSIVTDPMTGNLKAVRISGLQNSEKLLTDQRVHFTIYLQNNVIAYPKQNISPKINKEQWAKLRKGQVVTSKSDTKQFSAGRVRPMTEVMKPYLNSKRQVICVISVGSPVSNIQSDVQKIRYNLWIAAGFSALVAVIAAFFLSRYTANRINRLRAAAHKVANGDFDVTVPTGGRDEIHDLSVDFNRMSKSLKTSNAEVQRQEQRRREFMADAVHEMRTPLTTINGILEGMQYGALPEDSQEESIELMQRETKRLIRLVNDNLDYERIRTNSITLNKTNINIKEVVDRIYSQIKNKADEVHDDLIVTIDPNLTVLADYDRFVQIMFNIIQNAIQFTSDGKVEVSGNADDKNTEIVISDTGIGMSEEQLQNIWERYYKADASRMQTKGESGLGMAIVHQLVKAHDGTIKVSSEVGHGTTFRLTFPIAK